MKLISLCFPKEIYHIEVRSHGKVGLTGAQFYPVMQRMQRLLLSRKHVLVQISQILHECIRLGRDFLASLAYCTIMQMEGRKGTYTQAPAHSILCRHCRLDEPITQR